MGVRGVIIGLLIMILGFVLMATFLSPGWLFSIGVSIKTVNFINEQMKYWGMIIGIAIIIAGLIAMGKFD